MASDLQKVLKAKLLNGWRLFAIVSLPISLMVIAMMLSIDLSKGDGLSEMIAYSVRWAVPFIYLVVAASALQVLFPSPLSMWLLRNRKYLGLCFAVAMAWQGLFIFIVSTMHRDYYFDEIYAFRDELEGTIGYVFLGALVVTSFQFGRNLISRQQWTFLHTAGVIFFWAYPFSVYWWNIFYYPTLEPFNAPRLIDYLFYGLGFAAFAVRIAAWGKKRHLANLKISPRYHPPLALRWTAYALIVISLGAAVSGGFWREPASFVLYGPKASADAAEWLPFWPLEPFLPLIVLGLGVMLATSAKPEIDTDLTRGVMEGRS
ncbi:MAG: hypothetical protein AAF224_00055 [Pseudomonadota bacterium]